MNSVLRPSPLGWAKRRGWPPLRLGKRNLLSAFSPTSLGMDLWEPDLGYDGTPTSVTGLPNQRVGGLSLQYQGLSPAVLQEVNARNWLQTPSVLNQQQRLIANPIAETFGDQANAPFAVALAFSLRPESPATATLFTAASFSNADPQRINISMAGGFLRLFTVDASGAAIGVPTQALLQPGDGPESLVIVGRSDGTASVTQGGVLVDGNLTWSRPPLPLIDQFSFGSLVQGTSIGQTAMASYAALAWKGAEITNSEASRVALYMRERFH